MLVWWLFRWVLIAWGSLFHSWEFKPHGQGVVLPLFCFVFCFLDLAVSGQVDLVVCASL